MRTLARMVSVPPRRSNSRSCSTRSSLTWVARLISPISSRKSVPAFGELEAPLFAGMGAGKCALFVAEQLGFDQALGQRGATDFDERLVRAQRVVVNRVGDELLAGARLAANEHGRVGPGHLCDLFVDLPHGAARAHDVREVVAFAQLLPKMRIFLDKLLPFRLNQPLDFQRLRDHRGHDPKKLDITIVVAVRLELQIDANGAGGLPVKMIGTHR